jgi:hypothetical protein
LHFIVANFIKIHSKVKMGKGGKAKSVGGVDLSRMSESELRGHATYFNAGIADEVKKMVSTRAGYFDMK